MNTYIVFALNAPRVEGGALPDPLPTWAVITQKETEAEAVEFIVQSGALPAIGEVHACDITSTQSFKVTTDVSLEQSSSVSIPGTPTSPPDETSNRTLDAISPSTGAEAGGTPVLLRGSGLTDTSGVLFGTAWGDTFEVMDDETVSCFTPPGTGTVDVTVVDGAMGSPVLQGGFTYG